MSVENLFNNPVKKAKQKELTVLFDRTITNVRDMELGEEGDAIIKTLVKHYAVRRKEIEDEAVDLDADISAVPKRTRRKKEAATAVDMAEPAKTNEPSTERPLTAAQKKTQDAKNKNKKSADDDLTA